MGNKKSSPSVENKGDKDTTIINNQEMHTEMHEDNAFKLWLILILVCIQLLLALYKYLQKRTKKRTINRMKSIADLGSV